jgi:hypothetical protein
VSYADGAPRSRGTAGEGTDLALSVSRCSPGCGVALLHLLVLGGELRLQDIVSLAFLKARMVPCVAPYAPAACCV